jgi:hypothetical protein
MQQKYCLVYTNEKGEVHELSVEELEKFGQINENNRGILDLIYNPGKLSNQPMPEEKKF